MDDKTPLNLARETKINDSEDEKERKRKVIKFLKRKG